MTRARGRAASPERRRLLERLGAAAAAGASMIQIRERQLDDRQLAGFVADVRGIAEPHGTLVLVNDRIDVALATGAAGVHLKEDAAILPDVRRLMPPPIIVGQSVHSEQAARAAAVGGCDYLLFGTVFPSPSKPDHHPIAGVEALEAVCRVVTIPVLAIGGVTIERAAEVGRSGAAGVAAISLFAESPDVEHTVRELQRALTLPRRHV